MHLSDHSLRQLDETYLGSLGEEALRALSVKLLDDLKEARDRLHQGPENSSRPPSPRAVWERAGVVAEPEAAEAEAVEAGPARAETAAEAPVPPAASDEAPARWKAGKQLGAPG